MRYLLLLLWLLVGSIYGVRTASAKSAMAAPGYWFFQPARLISGTTTTLELHYRHGAKALPPGTAYAFELEGLSVSTLNHAPISTGLQLLPGTCSAIELTSGPIGGLDQRLVRLRFPHGLQPGEEFALRIGNATASGELQALINPVPVHALRNDVNTEPPGGAKPVSWYERGWWESLPTVDIEGGEPEYLRVFGPTLIQCDQPFDLRVALTDAFDNPAYPFYRGKVEIVNHTVASGLPPWLQFTAADEGSRRIAGVRLAKPGVYRLQLRIEGAQRIFESNPIVVRPQVEQPIYWGQLHNHGWYSECWGDGTPRFYHVGRDFSGLDYAALSDHALLPGKHDYAGRLYTVRHGEPISTYDACMEKIATANEFYAPGRFVSLLGWEWSSEQSGHYNVYLSDINARNYATIFSKKPHFAEYAHEMRAILSKTDALFLPHMHAAFFPFSELVVGRTRLGEPLSPVIETYSDWGLGFHPTRDPGNDLLGHLNHAPWALSSREAIGNGLMLGITADSDSHTGLPGRRCSANLSPGHCFVSGITAIRTRDLTREGVLAAYRRRATYGTSGEHIFLEVHAGKTPMGEVLRTDRPMPLDVEVAGTDMIRSVTVYNGTQQIAQQTLSGKREGRLRFELPPPTHDLVPYFVEVIQENEHRAWGSPVWIGKASLPDLAWQRDGAGKLWLVNQGPVAARHVRVLHDAKATPFVNKCVTEPRAAGTGTQGGLFWTHAIANNQLVVHFRWTGAPLMGKVTIEGQQRYRVEPNIRTVWFSTLKDLGSGEIEFDGRKGMLDRATSRPGPPQAEGFDLTITPKPDQACKVVYTFDREIPAYVGEKLSHVRRLEIPVNQFDASCEGLTIAEIPAGGRWVAPTAQGCWSANADGIDEELARDNNFYFAAEK